MQLKTNDLVLFQGDSITNGHRMPAEFNDLFQLGSGYAAMVAARIRLDRPTEHISFINRGVCGHTTRDLLTRWRPDCLDLKPTVLSMLIGINDSNAHARGERAYSPKDIHIRLQFLLQMTREHLPETRLVLLEPFLLTFDGIRETQVNHVKACQAIISETADTFGAAFIPLQEKMDALASAAGHPSYVCYDTIHPTAAGHCLIADALIETLTLG